jgi:hypothetical protein
VLSGINDDGKIRCRQRAFHRQGLMFRVKGGKAGIPTWTDQRHSFRDLRVLRVVPVAQPELLTPSNLLFPDI